MDSRLRGNDGFGATPSLRQEFRTLNSSSTKEYVS